MIAAPSRMDGYVRVSRVAGREGPGYISPDVQRATIEKWANYKGVEIVAWHVEEDESGGTQNRPKLREAIARVEAGETQGIACARLNRFARNVSAAIDDIKRIQAAGGSLACVEEDIDPTGPFGSFILTVLLAVATLERDNLVASWNVAKERSITRGALIGPTPLGYRRLTDGLIEPDPETAPAVRDAFRAAAEGDYARAVAVVQAVRPSYTAWHLRRLLRGRVYLGEQKYGDLLNREGHAPLVNRETWERAQPGQERAARASKRPYPLSHVAVCGRCGELMVGGSSGPDLRTYRCRASLAAWKGLKCKPAVTIVAENLEQYVLAELVRAYSEAAPDAALESDERAIDLDALHAEIVAAEAERDRFAADPTAAELLGPSAWAAALQARAQRVSDGQAAYRLAARTSKRVDLGMAVESLSELTPEQLGPIFKAAFAAVEVGPARVDHRQVPMVDRVRLVGHDDAAGFGTEDPA